MHQCGQGRYDDRCLLLTGFRRITIESREDLQPLNDFLLLKRIDIGIVGRGWKDVAVVTEEELKIARDRFGILMVGYQEQDRAMEFGDRCSHQRCHRAEPRSLPADGLMVSPGPDRLLEER